MDVRFNNRVEPMPFFQVTMGQVFARHNAPEILYMRINTTPSGDNIFNAVRFDGIMFSLNSDEEVNVVDGEFVVF